MEVSKGQVTWLKVTMLNDVEVSAIASAPGANTFGKYYLGLVLTIWQSPLPKDGGNLAGYYIIPVSGKLTLTDISIRNTAEAFVGNTMYIPLSITYNDNL